MRVKMALLKPLGYMCVLLVIYYSLKNQGYRWSLNEFSEQLLGTGVSHGHAVRKRQAESESTGYTVQVLVHIADLEQLRSSLRALDLPIVINGTRLTSISTTTVCSRANMTGYQCRCEESFAWSFNSCNTTGACDAITANTCGCINALPADGQYCQLNTSRTVTTPTSSPTSSPTTSPSTTTPQVLVKYNLAFDIRVPVSSVPSDFIARFRNVLRSIPIPTTVTSSITSINLTGLKFTTACTPISGSQQCQCENQFRWPCDICNRYACNDISRQNCSCINGLPSDGRFCEPTTSVNTTCIHETTTPVMTTTMPMTTTTLMTTATPMTTTTLMRTTTPTTTTTPEMTTTGGPTQPPQKKQITVVMDIPYQETYNSPDSQIYNDTLNSILSNCERVSIKCKVTDLRFRSGSTIADSTVSATSLTDITLEKIKTGVINQLGKIYPVITDSATPLTFSRTDVFFGERVSVTCGPPPSSLNFSTNWVAEWSVDDVLILADDDHMFSKLDDKAVLTVNRFFRTDNGVYECKMKDTPVTKAIFRQKSNGEFTFRETPVIMVKPERQKLECMEGELQSVTLTCSVQSPYTVQFQGINPPVAGTSITHTVAFTSCGNRPFTCEEATFTQFNKDIKLEFVEGEFDCDDDTFGVGNVDDVAIAPCEPNKEGEKTGTCTDNNGVKQWEEEDNCILIPVLQLLDQSENLNNNTLPLFLEELRIVAVNFTDDVTESPATINAIVTILTRVANISSEASILITQTSMTDILFTSGVLTKDEAQESWELLNAQTRRTVVTNGTVTRTNSTEVQESSASSRFLFSLESLTNSLINETFNIVTPFILLNKTTFTDNFIADFNSSVQIEIPDSGLQNHVITAVTFDSMDNVLPPRDKANSSFNVINGRVVLVQSNDVSNATFTFNVLNDTLGNPQCVFWNFSLFNGLGGWDDEGCELVFNINDTVTCNCNHLTSFSILMSPHIPEKYKIILDYITYVGVGISMASLIICLIIEGIIWRKIRRKRISYLRHVTIVNIAVSLLIADIWFIIGAAISDLEQENPPACTAATFFIHLFYLALFFWMLASGLLLFHGTVNVFGAGLSKNAMLGIGFSLGYGAPLLIAVITIAVTAPADEYIRGGDACWLNWFESKALLAFVIPALLIVLINLVILCVVIYKMVRRRVTTDATQAEERHVLVVIARSLAFLTPLFGLTWGLGVGTMTSPDNFGIHVSFAFFNSLQGFFILVFGTLLDKNVRSEIAVKSQTSSSGTRSTSAGMSSSSGLDFLRNWRRGRDGYNVSSTSGRDSYNT